MLGKLIKLLEVFNTRGALFALISWKVFSFASFKIVQRVKSLSINPRTVIDVGANIGQFTIACKKLFENPKIYPIEPDPRVAQVLKKNIGAIASQNVIVSAVGDYVGIANFNLNRDSQVSSLLTLGQERLQSFPKSYVMDKIEVPITTLDELFSGRNFVRPIMLKIDVQGSEDRVIEGARKLLKSIDWVLIETSFGELYEGEKDFIDMVKMMENYNFRFVRPLNFHTSPLTAEIIEMDALFENNNLRDNLLH